MRRLVGSWLDPVEAEETYANLLSENARGAARDRIENPEKGEAPLKDRLLTNLLSSMAMSFNLFGESWADHARATELLRGVIPDLPGEVAEVRFEWSPGRLDPAYLNNKTAFDVVLILDLGGQRKGIVGVETKYHEFAIREVMPKGDRLLRYAEVTQRAGCFERDWPRRLLASTLQQVWLDHLLALSMTQHQSGEWAWTRSVLVYPEKNVSFKRAAAEYRETLTDPQTFLALTVEQVLDAGALPGEVESDFRERYLW